MSLALRSLLFSCFFLSFAACTATDDIPDISRARDTGRSMWISSAWKHDSHFSPDKNRDSIRRIPSGETFVMADIEGPGLIQHIWMTIYSDTYDWAREGWAPDGTAEPDEVLLRIYWDNRSLPDVEAPLGDFFASGFGRRMEVNSLPVVVEDGDSYNCYWPMPFRKAARIELVNQSNKPVVLLYFSIDLVKKKKLPKNTLYFCAHYRQERPAGSAKGLGETDSEYLILETEGRGHYVGTFLSVRTRSPDWFGEGDMRVSIDGEPYPSLWGTGTEDYFCSAWGWKECSTPYFGVPFLNNYARDPGQMTCAYRWHMHDPIVFQKSLRVAVETMGWQTADENPEHNPRKYGVREDDFSSVAFWYQDRPSTPFAPTTTAQERKLPSLDRVSVWAGQMQEKARHGKGSTQLVESVSYRESGGLWYYTPTSAIDAWIEIPIRVEKKEPLRLLVETMQAARGGMYQVYLNGVPLRRPLDLYAPMPNRNEHHLIDFWPDPGEYVVRLECMGKNDAALGYDLPLFSVRLRERRPRVSEIGLHKDDDWRAEQFFYQRSGRNK